MSRAELFLILYKDGYEEWRLPLPEGESYLGRGDECQFKIDHANLSRKHIKFKRSGTHIAVENVSTFGLIKVNGEAREQVDIQFNDRVSFENYEVLVKEMSVEEATSEPVDEQEEQSAGISSESSIGQSRVWAQNEDASQRSVSQGSLALDQKLDPMLGAAEFEPSEGRTEVISSVALGKLVVLSGKDTGKEFPISKTEMIMGRSPSCDIVLNDETLSRKHTKIVRSGGIFRILDLESSNGTRVNGVRVIEHVLKSFDTIQIGDNELRFILMHKDWDQMAGQSDDGDLDPAIGGQSLVLGQNLEPVSEGHLQHLGLTEEGSSATSTYHAIQPRTSSGAGAPPGLVAQIRIKWDGFTKKQKAIYIVCILLITLMIAQNFKAKAPPNLPQESAPVATKATSDIPAEFFELPEDVRLEIERAYNDAVSAYQQGLWAEVIKNGNLIKSRLSYYKEIDELLKVAKDQYAKAEKERLESTAKEEATEKTEDVYYYLAEADKYLQEGNFFEAKQNYEKVLELDPNNEEAKRGREAAINQKRDKNWKEAQDKQFEEDDQALRAQLLEITAQVERGEYDAALAAIDTFIQSAQPHDSTILSQALMLKATAQSKRLSTFEPFILEGETLLQQGRYEDAFKACKAASDKLPEIERPRKCMEKAVMSLELQARAIYRDALIEEYLGNAGNARELYERIVQSFPPQLDYHKRAQKKLRRYDPKN